MPDAELSEQREKASVFQKEDAVSVVNAGLCVVL